MDNLNPNSQDFDFDAFASSLETKDILSTPSARTDNRVKHPCGQCGGSGRYRGVRLHQDKSHCFACKGKGYFFQSYADRMHAKQKRAQSKTKKLVTAYAAFEESNPGLGAFLLSAASWSGFARGMYEALQKYGSLTDRQLIAANSMREKCELRDAARAEKRAERVEHEANAPTTLNVLAQAFLSSSAHLKFPRLWMQTVDGLKVVLSRCGNGSKTPGHINITDGGPYGSNRYYGRITPDGKPMYRDDIPASVVALLGAFNADHKEGIKLQGIRTGRCCCCNRELTDPESVASGIGPICAKKWGF